MGALEGGEAIAFASGMAAAAAVVEGRPAGSVAVAPAAAYGGISLLFAEQVRLGRMTVHEVDITDTTATVAALTDADLIWVESPTNPLLGVADLPPIVEAAHTVGATVYVDSTFNTPLVARPLDLGADVVMHAATKALAGHSDLLMGVLVTRSPERAEALRTRRIRTGAMPGALECYLALRGLRTLAVRMERAQANAMRLAAKLSEHPRVSRVRYPGLPSDPFHERATRLHRGYGTVISFDVDGSAEDAEAVCERVELITHATSLGGVESLIERRARYETDAAQGTPPSLLRLSVASTHRRPLGRPQPRAGSPLAAADSAVAIAARPSPRPVSPSPSVVVAASATGGPPIAADNTSSASARRRARRGVLPISCTATLPTIQPSVLTRLTTRVSRSTPRIPDHCGSDTPTSAPRSPSPAAESRASQAAWATTSPSEWPAHPSSPGHVNPARWHGRPGSIGCTSTPIPVRITGGPPPRRAPNPTDE